MDVIHVPPGRLPARTPDNLEFPGAALILAGFDRDLPNVGCHVGDRVLYAVRLEKEGRAQTWYALIEVVHASVAPGTRLKVEPDPTRTRGNARGDGGSGAGRPLLAAQQLGTLTAPVLAGRAVRWAHDHGLSLSPNSVLVRIDVFNERAEHVALTHQFVFEDYLRSGLYQSCDTVRRYFLSDEEPSESEVQQVSLSFVSLFCLGELLWGTPHVGQIFDEIVRRPSWVSILLCLGVRPAFIMHFEQSIREGPTWPALADGRRAYRVPFEIRLNDEPALRCFVIAAPNEPPLRLCGGIIGLEGADVREPQNRFTVRLLAARHGESPMHAANAR